jgi:NADH dehydrogenase [ubiquinone] 1 alpha subcomplex assembly factor 7
MTAFQQQLKDLIVHSGPMSVETFMSLAIGHYYSTRDPFGVQGDFTTAPEISQMFGEMIGVFMADAWMKMGSPPSVLLVEAGPGRGTLMADLLRATKNIPGFHQAARIHLIEMSPVLKEKQRAALNGFDVEWHETLETLPDAPMLFIGNEFLDALPIRQYQFQDGKWFERVIGLQGDEFVFGLGLPLNRHPGESREPYDGERNTDRAKRIDPMGPGFCRDDEDRDIFERSFVREEFVQALVQRIQKQTGVALLIDYGHDETACGNTLQAVKDHKFIPVLTEVGEADLTSHVDFASLKKAAEPFVKVHGPTGQGDFLKALGIAVRAARLNKNEDAARLTEDNQMGRLFRVMALCHDENLKLAGFGI